MAKIPVNLTKKDWLELGYKGKLKFICCCGCNKTFIITVVDFNV